MTSPRSAALEQVFRRVERESEQRALEAELREAASRQARIASPPPLHSVASVPILTAGSSYARERRRGSVVMSRVGQLEEPINHTPIVPFGSMSKTSSSAPKTPLYNQPLSCSVDSFGSDSQTSPMDDHVTTQVHHFPRKQSISRAVGGMLTRTLSRSRSKPDLKPHNHQNVVIGVSVEEATVEQEHHDQDQEGMKNSSKSISTVQGSSRTRPSDKTLDHEDRSGWVSKAKGFMVQRRGRVSGRGEKSSDITRAPNRS